MPGGSIVWLISTERDSPVTLALMGAFREFRYSPWPREPSELQTWIERFEVNKATGLLPQLIVWDARIAERLLLRTLRGKSPWNGIPTLAYGPSEEIEKRFDFYRAGFSAFCHQPDDSSLGQWAQSIARYWCKVTELPTAQVDPK